MHIGIFGGCSQTFYDTKCLGHLMLIKYNIKNIYIGFGISFTLKDKYGINSIHFFSFEG
jgi:hypothetical protein